MFYRFGRVVALWTGFAILAGPFVTASQTLPSREASAGITTRDLKKHLTFLASDELGGRYTFSPSLRVAARYLASQLESYGFRGAGPNGSFFQPVPLAYRTVDVSQSAINLTSAGTVRPFKYLEDFGMSTPAALDLMGELVFVGYGISTARYKHDDYSGVDVKGKIAVYVDEGVPQSLKGANLTESERGERVAQARGAIGAIAILPYEHLLAWESVRAQTAGEQLTLPMRFPEVFAGPGLARALFTAIGIDSGDLGENARKRLVPRPLGVNASIRMSVAVREAPPTQNVVAVLDGSDVKLKQQYISLSAHYDHLEAGADGEVFNGADDDASGTSAVLELAEAFATGPRPRRSVLIVFHTGEELGLFGSEYNTDYAPVVPLENVVVNLNIDMIGRVRAAGNNDPRDQELLDQNSLYVIGANRLSTQLHRLNEQTNAETSRLKFDYTYNDDNNPQRFFYRSDHYNYARHGIPIIFYFTGPHRDYHQTTDDVDKIDFEKMVRVTRLIFAVGWRVANAETRPVLDEKAAFAASGK